MVILLLHYLRLILGLLLPAPVALPDAGLKPLQV